MVEKFLQNNFQLIEILKKNELGKTALIFDKKNRRLCIFKNISSNSVELYRKLKSLENEHIPKIFHIFETFIIEEFIEGQNLAEVLEKEKISEEKIFDWILQLCACLKILHDNKIIHRDIKPSNIILRGEKIFLIDFGIAREIKNISESDTEWLGTRGYAPPEQFGFSQTDCRSDIYALGVTLKLLQPKSERLQKIIRKATNFNPVDRFQSVDEILNELQEKNFFLRFKTFFLPPKKIEQKKLDELLQKNLSDFKIILPSVEDYRFRAKKYSLEKKLKYPDDYQYIYDTEVEADVAGMISFDENIYSQLDEYIAQVLEMYQAEQLKNFLAYDVSENNFYYKINSEIEKRIEKIFDNFSVPLPPALKEFSCTPDEIIFDAKKYVPQVRNELENLAQNKSLHYQIYILTQKTARRTADKKFAFHIDKAVDALFGDIIWAVGIFSETSDELREDIQNSIRQNYLEKFRRALNEKATEIKNFLLKK